MVRQSGCRPNVIAIGLTFEAVKTVRVLAWYDNKRGFSDRMADVAVINSRLHQY